MAFVTLLIPLSLFASDPTKPITATCSRIKDRPLFGPMPAASSNDAAIPEADRLDDGIWRTSQEGSNAWNEIVLGMIEKGAEYEQATGKTIPRTTHECAVLIQYMKSPHFFARRLAVIAASSASAEPGRSMVMPYVTGLLTDRVYTVRFSAVGTLEWIGDKNTTPYLEPLLMDRPDIPNAARRAILKLQKREPEQQSEE